MANLPPLPPSESDEFDTRVYAALGITSAHLPTLHSVLAVEQACEAEVALDPVYSGSGFTRASGNLPRRAPLPLTVQQAMVRAADTGVEVVLTLAELGRTFRHACRVSRAPVKDDPSVWFVDPSPPDYMLVRTGDSKQHLPLVTACEPALTSSPAPPRRLSVLPANAAAASGGNGKLLPGPRLPPSYRGADFHVVETVDGGWVMEAGHENDDGPFGEKYVEHGDRRDTKDEAVIDAWVLANEILIADIEAAQAVKP